MALSLKHFFGTVTTLIAVCFIFSIGPAADSKPQKCGDNAEFTISKDGVLTVTGTGDMYNIDPSKDKLEPIAGSKDASKVKKIVIGEGITSVGDYNFSYMKNLKKVTLPSTLTRIGHFSFYDDEKLGNVTLPADLDTLGQSCFGFCKGMTSVTIPAKVNSMDETFFGCTNIVKAYIDGSADTAKDHSGFTAPFRECYKLKDIKVNPEHALLYVKDGVLYDRETNDLIQYPLGNKNTTFRIPAETVRVKSSAMLGAEYLDMLIVDHKCEFGSISVGSGSWSSRSTKIAIFAEKCSDAYKFYRSVSKDNEEKYAFFELKRLENVVRSGSILYEKTGGKTVNYLHNSDRKLTALKVADTVKLKGKIYKITSIEAGCFMSNNRLTNVTLGKNIKSVGKNAFKNCLFLQTVKVPKGRKSAYKKILKKSGLNKNVSIE